ncbi:MAG: septum site-determining protein MinD [Chloroflexi bacterium]|nr:septum site-determining protein MinD [Chloroflexota bacterium]
MGKVVTVTSGKGGVGKTTVTGNLAVALARQGHQVVCLDLDIGLRNLDLVLGLENRIVYDVVDVIEGRVRLRQALVRDKRLDGLHLLPAAQWREKDAMNEKQVIQLCRDLSAEFDVVLVDSPAGIEEGFRNAVAPADQVLLVTTPEVSAIRDVDRVRGLLAEAGKPPPKLIINRVRPAMVKRGDMMGVADVLDILKIELMGIVPEDASIIADTNVGTPTALSRRTGTSQAFALISRRLMGEEIPVATLETRNLLGRLGGAFVQMKKSG